LKRVKNIDSAFKADRIDCPIGVSAVVFDHFENASSLPFPGFRVGMLAAKLGHTESRANTILDGFGECQ
jgi:hypothetical protein